ncbi:MAG TPA: hypothetical protein VD791_02755, partial [Burkholderiales bacterium]|nr:hypothetical protein [Burkholderiales bacterium]
GNVAIMGATMYVGGAELREALQAAAEGAPERISAEAANKAATALLLSLRACLANMLPFLLYGALMSALFFVALLPLFVGLAVWVPIAVISAYTSYRDVFGSAPTPA